MASGALLAIALFALLRFRIGTAVLLTVLGVMSFLFHTLCESMLNDRRNNDDKHEK